MGRVRSVWRRISPTRNIVRLCDWLGPRGTLLMFCGLIWIQTGIGTFQGYSGKPSDAPHLLMPAVIRGVLWLLPGILALALCATRSVKWHKIAITSLGVAPVIRLCSYLMSWIFSWTVFQTAFPNFPLEGSANAEYASTFWQAELLLVFVLMIAPATWKMVNTYLIKEESGIYDRVSKPRGLVESGDNNTNGGDSSC